MHEQAFPLGDMPRGPGIRPEALAATLLSLGLPLGFGSLATPAAAQQYVVDDAAIVDYRTCHVEAWHGERASWILPACQPVGNLEIAAGVGFVDEGDDLRETEYAVEAKTLLRPLEPNDWGVGLVLGAGPNPSAAAGERHLAGINWSDEGLGRSARTLDASLPQVLQLRLPWLLATLL